MKKYETTWKISVEEGYKSRSEKLGSKLFCSKITR